jgi:hypothetical protein
MFSRLKRTATSFLVVLLAFGVYRLAAEPFVDPRQQEEKRVSRTTAVDPTPLAPQNRLGPYLRFFPEGSWERNNPMVMESNTAKVVIGKYEVGDGRGLNRNQLKLEPCTLIFFPEGETETIDSHKRVIVMRTERAVLQFENEIDMRTGQLGKLIGGDIPGPVVIYSAATSPEGNDDLEVHARDLKMVGNEILSSDPVKFRFGPSYGSGREMKITLLPAQGGTNSIAPSIGGIQDFKLMREVQMHLQPSDAGIIPGDEQARQKLADRNQPVDIRCSGPFTFDMVTYVAEFQDDVVMWRPSRLDRNDSILASMCSVYFAEREPPASEKAASKPSLSGRGQDEGAVGKRKKHPHPDPLPKGEGERTASEAKPGGQRMPRLVPQKFEARGNPVVVDAPSNGVYAEGNHIEYDASTGHISLQAVEGAKPVHLSVRDAKDGTARALEAEARTLHFQSAPKGRVVGKLYSEGPGWLRATPEDNPDEKIHATWQKKLELRPEQNPENPQLEEHLLWIVGNPHVDFTGQGQIDADEQICLWLSELPTGAATPTASQRAAQNGASPGSLSNDVRARVRPARLRATGKVHLESRQLDGDLDDLQVWFRAAAPIATNRNRPPRDPNRQRSTGQPQERHTPRDPEHYKVACRQLNAELVLNGSRSEIAYAKLVDNVKFEQTPEKMGQPSPLAIEGNWLELRDADTPRRNVVVAGNADKPAIIAAEGMTMRGATVNLDTASNRMWIDGPGEMNLVQPPKPAGQIQTASASNQPRDAFSFGNSGPVKIDWQQGMNFDGRTVRFIGGVVARQNSENLEQSTNSELSIRTEQMDATLDSQFNFNNTRRPEKRPEVEWFVAHGKALLDNRSFKMGQPVAFDHMELTELTMNQISGETKSQGPGFMKSWRYGPKQELSSLGPSSSAPRGPNAAAKPEEFQITYSRIEFQNGIQGKVLKNYLVMTFQEQVRGIFGAVPDWNKEHADEAPQPGKVVLHGDNLTARQMGRAADGTLPMEVEIAGNTHVESMSESGALITAMGHIINYDQAKDFLILKGLGTRSPATIIQQERIGAPQRTSVGPEFSGSPRKGNFQGRILSTSGSMTGPAPTPRAPAPPSPQR